MRRVTSHDVTAVADTLARAFEDDPIQTWLFGNDRTRLTHLRRMFAGELNHRLLRFGEGYADDDLSAVALWAPPGHWRPTFIEAVRGLTGYLPAIRRLPAGVRGLTKIEHAHPREPHWYLNYLGTVPERQGKGFATHALAPVLARCDDEGMPAYLESSKEKNLAFYARHGFELTEQLDLGAMPPVWLMWREPRPPA